MSTEQPEASGSTPTRRNYHLNTFVFDSATLPKESYVKLIEQDGVIHKIVQRLMEKSQGKDDLRLSVVITASPATVCSRKQQHIEEFTSPNTFLTSLPRLAAKFPRDGSGLVKDLEWPGFGKGEAIVNEKGEVNYLLNGLIVGVEMLESSTYSMVPRSPPTSWSNITPSPGQSVLQTVYTPPFMSSTVSSSQHRNLIVVTGSSSQHLDQLESNGRRASYDETSWERLSDRVKRAGILCSKLTWTRPGYNDFGKPNPLGKLVNHAGDDQADDVWFSLPQEYQIHLVGFTIDKAPSPPAGTNDTPTLSAPTPNAAVLQTTDANKNQLLAQQQALRAIYSQASRASNTSNQNGKPTIDQNVLQNIMTAAKNGHLDLTNPALQQFKQMVMLQQQQAQMRNAQQAAAASQAGGQSSSGPPGGTNGTGEALAPNMDQMVQQAVRQQQTVQQQPGYGQGHNGAGMGNNVLQQQPAQPSQPQAQPPQATPQQLQQMQQIYQQRQQQQQQEQQQQQQQQLQQHQQQLQQNQMPQQQPQRNQQTPQIPQAQILPDRSEHQQAPPQPQHQNQQIQQPQVQQPQQMQPPPQQPQQMQRQQQPKPEKLWTGSLVLNLAPNNIYAMLVDAYPFNMSAGSNYQLEHWPADCKIAHMTQMATADLHAYQRAHTLPVIFFSAASTGEGSNAQRYQQFVFNLGAKSNMAVIQFGTSDRGILLFTTSSTSGNGPRLMGLVCVVGHKNPLGMSGLINQEAPLPVQARTQLAGVQSQPQQPQTTQQPNQQQIQQQQVLQQPSFQQPPHQTMAALPQLPAGMTPQQVQQIQAARQSSQRAQQPSQQQQQQLQQRQAAAAAAQAQAQAQAQVQAVAQAQAQAQQKLQGQSYQQQYSQQLQQQQAIQQQQLNYQQSQPQSVQQYQQQQQPQQQQQMAQPQSQVQQGFQYGQPPVNRQQAMDALNHFAGQMTSTQSQNQPLPTMSQHGQQNAGRAQSQAVQIDGRAYAKLLESARKYDIKLPSHAEIKGINQDQLSQIIAVIKNAEATSNNKAAQQQIQQQLQQQAAQQRQQQVQQQQQQQQQQHQQRQQNPQLPQMPPPQQMSDLSQQNNGLGQMGQMSQMAQMAQMGQFNPAMMNQLGMQNQMAMQGQQGYGQQMQSGQYGMNMPMGIQQGQGQGQSQGQGQQGMGYNAMGSMGMQGQYMQQQ